MLKELLMNVDNFPRLILASNSPRRHELLKLITKDFDIIPADMDEHSDRDSFDQRIIDIAQQKAKAVQAMGHEGVILGADTSIDFEGQLIGKPKHREDAAQMLRNFSGQRHTVLTGMCLIRTDTNQTLTACVRTDVWFKILSQSQVEWYLSSEKFLDKAGAYAIQGKGALMVDRIQGDYFNIMGLPVSKLSELLIEIGYPIFEGR
jgi:septum formation protein